jgi:chitodextrinase
VKKLVFLLAFLLVGVATASPNVVSTTQTSVTIENLDCGTKFRFEIRKYAPNGELSSNADSVDAETKSCPDTQPPSQPQNLAATGATQTSISVSWTASTDDVGVTGYDVYRGGARVDSTSATSYAFGGLSCGTTYTLAVEARDAAGKRSSSSAITASTSACPPPSCPSGEYSAHYYENSTLSGAHVLHRCEAAVNHDWGGGSPAANVPTNQFSARWTGTFSFEAGAHEFTAAGDDGIRVWVDGTPLIDAWKDQAPTTYQATRLLTAGDHVVKVEYYENGGGAVARLSWQLSQLPAPPPPPPPAGPPPPPSPGVAAGDVLTGAGGFDHVNELPDSASADVSVTSTRAYSPPNSYRFSTEGVPASDNHIARGMLRGHEIRVGDEVWFGAAVYLPVGFYAAANRWLDGPVRWQNWATYGYPKDNGGLSIRTHPGGDERLVLSAWRTAGSFNNTLVVGPRLTEGTWHTIDILMRFSQTNPYSELWVDDVLIGSSTLQNYDHSRPFTIDYFQYGLVGTSNNDGPLEIFTDDNYGP